MMFNSHFLKPVQLALHIIEGICSFIYNGVCCIEAAVWLRTAQSLRRFETPLRARQARGG